LGILYQEKSDNPGQSADIFAKPGKMSLAWNGDQIFQKKSGSFSLVISKIWVAWIIAHWNLIEWINCIRFLVSFSAAGKFYRETNRRVTIWKFATSSLELQISGLPDFSWYSIPKRGKIYQMTTNYTKWP
jgi:hypothetical protein